MKKIILSLFLFLGIFLLSNSSTQAGPQCTAEGGTCTGVRGGCAGKNIGQLDCPGVGAGGQTCCLPEEQDTSDTNSSDPMAGCGANSINTAIGCIPVGDTNQFMGWLLGWAVGVGGGIAFLLIVYASFMIMTSQGVPDRLKAGQELLTSAISGLIMLIFAVFILKFIGIDILKLNKL